MTVTRPEPGARNALHIGLSLSPTWLRGGAWRRDDSRVEELYSLDFPLDAARAAERAGLDFLFKPDAPLLDPAQLDVNPGFGGLDPVVLMAALAAATSRIGLVPTAQTLLSSPYPLARQLYSLDQLSGGRVGWNAVVGLGGAGNVGHLPAPEHADRYPAARELIEAVQGLGRGFLATAILADRAGGRYADPDLIGGIAGRAVRFPIEGALTLPALSPAPLPLFTAGFSPESRDLAARLADAVFAATPRRQDASALRAELRERAVGHGRAPDAVRVLPGLSLFLADDAEQAAELYRRAAQGAGPARGAAHWQIVGTVDRAAAEIEDWWRAGAVDGFIALPGGSWDSLRRFTDRLVPELVGRGLFRAGYTGTTLADHLGVHHP